MAFKLICKTEDRYKSGIYRITIGEKIYVGKAILMYKRIRNHQGCINANINRTGLKNRKYDYIAQYIVDNNISEGTVDVLEECKGNEMAKAEAKWIRFFLYSTSRDKLINIHRKLAPNGKKVSDIFQNSNPAL